MESNKALIKDEEADSVDVHLFRSMIGSLMYLTASRPDIMFAVYACARRGFIYYMDGRPMGYNGLPMGLGLVTYGPTCSYLSSFDDLESFNVASFLKFFNFNTSSLRERRSISE
ncbi:hypothetical protein Tco_0036148 [Tanacetum coccineum]